LHCNKLILCAAALVRAASSGGIGLGYGFGIGMRSGIGSGSSHLHTRANHLELADQPANLAKPTQPAGIRGTSSPLPASRSQLLALWALGSQLLAVGSWRCPPHATQKCMSRHLKRTWH